jgi:hypothetical protein
MKSISSLVGFLAPSQCRMHASVDISRASFSKFFFPMPLKVIVVIQTLYFPETSSIRNNPLSFKVLDD